MATKNFTHKYSSEIEIKTYIIGDNYENESMMLIEQNELMAGIEEILNLDFSASVEANEIQDQVLNNIRTIARFQAKNEVADATQNDNVKWVNIIIDETFTLNVAGYEIEIQKDTACFDCS